MNREDSQQIYNERRQDLYNRFSPRGQNLILHDSFMHRAFNAILSGTDPIQIIDYLGQDYHDLWQKYTGKLMREPAEPFVIKLESLTDEQCLQLAELLQKNKRAKRITKIKAFFGLRPCKIETKLQKSNIL